MSQGEGEEDPEVSEFKSRGKGNGYRKALG